MRTASAAGPEPIMSPELSTTAKSQIWRTRSEEWVTNRMVRPSSWNSLILAMHLREKASSPDGQHLVHHQDVGVDVDRHGEAEPDVHPRRVVLHLVVDELLELGEGHDLVEALVDVLGRQAQQRRVEVDVLPSRQLGLEAGPELQQCGQAAPHHDLALGGLEDPRHALEQGRLARAVAAQDPDGLALGDLEADVPQRPEVLVGIAPRVQEALLERLVLLGVEPEPLRHVLDVDGDVGRHPAQSSSAKLPSSRPNTTMAPKSSTNDTARTIRSDATYQWIP